MMQINENLTALFVNYLRTSQKQQNNNSGKKTTLMLYLILAILK